MKKRLTLALSALVLLATALVGSAGVSAATWPPVRPLVTVGTDGKTTVVLISVWNFGPDRVTNLDVRAGLHGNRLLASWAGNSSIDYRNPARNYGDHVGWTNQVPLEPGQRQETFGFAMDNSGEGSVTHVWIRFKTETGGWGEVSTPVIVVPTPEKGKAAVRQFDPFDLGPIAQTTAVVLPWPPVRPLVAAFEGPEVTVVGILIWNTGPDRVISVDVRAGLHGNRLLTSWAGGSDYENRAKNYGDHIGWVNQDPVEPGELLGPFFFVMDKSGEGPYTHVWARFKTESASGDVSTPVYRAMPISEDLTEEEFAWLLFVELLLAYLGAILL